jgi:hypothetical protein
LYSSRSGPRLAWTGVAVNLWAMAGLEASSRAAASPQGRKAFFVMEHPSSKRPAAHPVGSRQLNRAISKG